MPPGDDVPVVVFDLDGTILRVNSFPRWVMFLIIGRLPGLDANRRMALSLRTLLLLLQRKLVGASHEEFQRHLQAVWRSACAARPDATLARFEATLLRRIRPNLTLVLDLVASDRIDAVLATAAAEDYAASLGRRLGFRHVLATSSSRGRGEPANAGARKREQVLALLDARGWRHRPMILFTDHVDDLPLMRDSRAVYWCGAPNELAHVAAAAANARFVVCRDLNGEAVALHLSEACQSDRLLASAAS